MARISSHEQPDTDGAVASDPTSLDRTAASDETLVAASQAGDRDAVEMLLRRHHDRILGVCRRMCRDPDDADDAAQEALIAIVRGLPHFDGRSLFSTWAYRVTTNCCLDELRRRRRRPLPIDESDVPTEASTDALPDEELERSATRLALSAALERLPEEFRMPLVLRDIADLDYATIAEILDLAPGTVRSRISRGRARLADALSSSESDDTGNRIAPTDVQPDESTHPGSTPG